MCRRQGRDVAGQIEKPADDYSRVGIGNEEEFPNTLLDGDIHSSPI